MWRRQQLLCYYKFACVVDTQTKRACSIELPFTIGAETGQQMPNRSPAQPDMMQESQDGQQERERRTLLIQRSS